MIKKEKRMDKTCDTLTSIPGKPLKSKNTTLQSEKKQKKPRR